MGWIDPFDHFDIPSLSFVFAIECFDQSGCRGAERTPL